MLADRMILPKVVFFQNKQPAKRKKRPGNHIPGEHQDIKGLPKLILFGRNQFEVIPDLLEGGLFVIKDPAGAVETFDATESQADGAKGHEILKPFFLVVHGINVAADDQAEAFFFILKFAHEFQFEALLFRFFKGAGIETMLDSVVIAKRCAMMAGIGIAKRGTAFVNGGGVLARDRFPGGESVGRRVRGGEI
jgi:hypothetical protein